MNIDVSVIIINYRNCELTNDAINSVIEHSYNFNYEIIVVDNSNDDKEFDRLISLIGSKAKCINAHSNLGFGKGNNLGVKNSIGKYVYFLNNDTLLMNNAIYELFNFIDNHPNVGIVGSNLYSKDGKPNHSFSRLVSNTKNSKKENSLINTFKRFLFKRPDFNYSTNPLKVGGSIMGASMMMSRDNFDKLGGFDKDIFMYAEETYLCYRMSNELGLEMYNIPSSKIIHFEGGSFGSEEKNMTLWRATELSNGQTIYLTKAFGKQEAIKFCKFSINNTKRKLIIAKITHLKKIDGYLNSIKAYENKLKELEL